ncbi:MAG: hypothetical protein HY820_07600 [Acidobacteria bacterium]|nr:hypothetical protein [Acidobacteriota bacterium]
MNLSSGFTEGIAKSPPADAVPNLRAMFAVLDQTGGRKGTWSLHVTRNWRLTFRVDADELLDVNFEDCH